MIIQKKEFYCRACEGRMSLKKNQIEPESCPFCGIDKFGKSTWTSKYIHKESR